MYIPIPTAEEENHHGSAPTTDNHGETILVVPPPSQSHQPPRQKHPARRRHRRALTILTVTIWLGSIMFGIFTAGHYVRSALWLNQWELWDLSDRHLYRPGQPGANTLMVTHLMAGTFLMMAGPIQLIPAIRKSFGFVLHRVTGRLYITAVLVAATTVSTFVLLYRTSRKDIYEDAGNLLLGCLVIVCAIQSYRTIRFQKNVQAHKWWSYRLYALIVSLLLYRLYIVVYFALTRYTAWQGSRFVFESMFFAFYIPNLFVVELYKRVPPTLAPPDQQQVNAGAPPTAAQFDDEQTLLLGETSKNHDLATASNGNDSSYSPSFASNAAAPSVVVIVVSSWLSRILYSPTLLIFAAIFVALTTLVQMVFNWVPSMLQQNAGQSNDIEKPYG